MATLDLPSTSAAEVLPGIIPADLTDLEALEPYGAGVPDEEYCELVATIIGQQALISTETSYFRSRLKFTLRYSVGPQVLNKSPTVIRKVENDSLLFDLEYHVQPDPVLAIAPLDRAVTTIYLPKHV